ncbi:MAG: ABC transporter permease [Oscillospiraceae bacterium]|nr:ABC transporter permease [Oscillospiraceae bacterium]
MGSLILHNLKKSRGSFVSFGIVMAITALILNTALVLLFQTSDAYDKLFDELNTAEISAAIPYAMDSDETADDIAALEVVSKTDSNEALFAQAALQEFQGSEFTMNTFFYRLSDERELSLHKISGETGTDSEMNAYIPLYLSELGGYKIGEPIRYIIDGTEYKFTVKGIVSEMQYGNYGTGYIGLYLSDSAYDKIKDDDNFMQVREYLIKTAENADIASVKKSVSKLFKDSNIPTLALMDSVTSKGSRTMVSSAIVLFLAAFAFIVLLVSIFLSRFKVKNTIDEEINEMGVLKGVGYTSPMLMFSQVIPYVIVCGIGLIAGVVFSYGLIPTVAGVLAVQSGFSYTPVFDISAALITVVTILAVVFIFILTAAGKIKKLEPINAIRGIDPLKPAAKNSFPLDTSSGSVGFDLILKHASESVGRNVLLFAVTFVLMTLLAFTGVLLFNVNVRPENFLTTLSEELPDVRVKAESGKTEELLSIPEMENVKAVKYGVFSMEYADGNIPTIVCEDFSRLENNIMYKGSHPKASDEIAIGSAFEEKYGIGDKFTLTQDGKEYDFTVTGFIQSVNNNGLIAEITDEGCTKMTDEPLEIFNLYLADGADISAFVKKLENDHSDLAASVSNAAEETKSMQMMYSSLITIVAAVLFIMTVFIVMLILYVILRSMLTSMKTEFGIYKAMGFTSGQLITRTVGSITPVVFGSALASALLGILYLPAMFGGIFGVLGAVKNNFEMPVFLLIVMAVILTAVNIIIGIILCRPIKKINPYSLIKE